MTARPCPRAGIGAMWLLGVALAASPGSVFAQPSVSASEVERALDRAVTFFHDQCSKHGGYVWRYSRDLTLCEGEGEADEHLIWVQPPGTPAVGEALLDAYDATENEKYLRYAKETATALVRGQLQSGGWYYSIEFDPDERPRFGYRDNDQFRLSDRRKNRTNITTLDDDTTQAALRFLMRMDKMLGFEDQAIHEAVAFALEALLAAQFPNGGWKQNWDRYPEARSTDDFPVIAASYPAEWSRKWLNDWRGVYYLNDDVAGDMLRMMLLADETYDDDRYLQSARRTGDFFVLAQMPDPQPAWAQQYDEQMQPVWDRKFEPPAVSGHESQFAIRALFDLYRAAGDTKYLMPIPRALEYLESSELPDGRLARFYELETNRPLYFYREENVYTLTYNADRLPTHYAFIVSSRVDRFAAEYERLLRDGPPPRDALNQSRASRASLARQVRRVIDALDDRGAWVDEGNMRGFNKASPEGVIRSETFIENVRLLAHYLMATD